MKPSKNTPVKVTHFGKYGKWVPWLLLAAGLLTHFAFFGHPGSVVFDEVHFGKFISGYYTHQYFFDIHPPLGKLIIAGFGKLFHFRPDLSFANIGEKYPDHKYLALRFLPSLSGALLVPVVYLLALELGLSSIAALGAGIFVLLENSLIVQSRLILLDGFLLLFGFAGLLCYFRWRNGGSKYLALAAGALAAGAVSVKWTGASFLAIMLALEAWHIWQHWELQEWRHLVARAATFILLPFVMYFCVFWAHFALLTKSGTGDAFMTPGFQKTLKGNSNEKQADLKTPNLFRKFTELNVQMYQSNQRLTATHPYSSLWYTWPFMARPIFYWVEGNQRIYLLGNPVIWWASTAAVLSLLLSWLAGKTRRDLTAWILLGGYALNMLPFVGIHRVMFLYHYTIGLVFAILMLAYLIDHSARKPKKWVAGLALAALASFIYFSPLTYGLTLSPKSYENHVWVKTWR